MRYRLIYLVHALLNRVLPFSDILYDVIFVYPASGNGTQLRVLYIDVVGLSDACECYAFVLYTYYVQKNKTKH